MQQLKRLKKKKKCLHGKENWVPALIWLHKLHPVSLLSTKLMRKYNFITWQKREETQIGFSYNNYNKILYIMQYSWIKMRPNAIYKINLPKETNETREIHKRSKYDRWDRVLLLILQFLTTLNLVFIQQYCIIDFNISLVLFLSRDKGLLTNFHNFHWWK